MPPLNLPTASFSAVAAAILRRHTARLAILCLALATIGLTFSACGHASKNSAPTFVQGGYAPPPPLPSDVAPAANSLLEENTPASDSGGV